MPAMTALKPTSRSASNTTQPVARNDSLTASGRALRAVLRNPSRATSTTGPLASSRSDTTSLTFDPSSKQRTRHGELWCDPKPFFKDGRCVVICAEDQLYCMVKRPLYTVAPAFPTAFAGKENMYNGCPVVVLNESSYDVENFLLALFSDSFAALLFQRPLSDIETYRTCANILRLSHQYRARSLRKRALRTLQPMFPTTLTSLDALKEQYPLMDLWGAHSAGRLVVDAARAAGADWLLPSATLFLLSESLSGNVHCPLRSDELLMGQRYARLWEESVTDILAPLGCVGCNKQLASRATEVRAAGYRLRFSTDIVLEEKSRFRRKMCANCKDSFKERYDERRLTIWESLPELCGLRATWPVLLRQMRKDVGE
ncbi:hypothetical protein EV714DRAFT_287816 [Schizophyllum commune]